MLPRLMLFIFTLFITGSAFAEQKKVALVVKGQNIGFFDAVNKGAVEAANEIGDIQILYSGPESGTSDGQIKIVMSLIAQKVDAIVISAIDSDALVPVLRNAMRRGIKVVSFDSAVSEHGRQIHLNPSNSTLIGETCIEMAVDVLKVAGKSSGNLAILSAASTSTNQNMWIDEMKKVLPKYPLLSLKTIVYGDDEAEKSYQETKRLLKEQPDIDVIISPSAVGIVAAARYVNENNLTGKVYVTGLGLPSLMAPYVGNSVHSFAIWNPIDLGYSATTIAINLINGKIGTKNKFSRVDSMYTQVDMGRMGRSAMDNKGAAVMAPPMIYNASNIEEFKSVF